ncbi:MAG: DUF3109 family protein [Flavobacteriales bacterium]|nr:DUF3109 family protein [Flavobacteriales bacterium]
MIIVGETLVSEELFEECFVCDLQACKGACCVEGESGAPLENDELDELEAVYEIVKPYMREEGIQAIEEKGLYTVDHDGDLVTTLVGDHGACSFVVYDSHGIAKCALEQAYLDGKTTWKKPISCHLYPVRLANLKDYTAVNYHRWQLCKPACECGSKLQVRVFQFLKEPLTRRFGEEWFKELFIAFNLWKEGKTTGL